MNTAKSIMLDQIQKSLSYFSVESELRNDRAEGEYLNIGNINRKSQRVQFWYDTKKDVINVWVGIEMGKWAEYAACSPYRKKWSIEKDHEYYVSFPDLVHVIVFLNKVTGLLI